MNERTIFIAALDIGDSAQRCAYLDESCGGDLDLRKRVEALIHSHEQADSFLNSPPPEIEATDILGTRAVTEVSGDSIGPYKLLQQIGEGGMGVVFMAEQTEPIQRTVALKIIKPGMDTRQVIARFEAERQAVAMMDHPNIAKVLDAGTTDSGRPYFVMELVKGVPITKYCDEKLLPLRARLELFVQVCQAVQHAHQKGIIHRDIKPNNVLVAEYDNRAVPKVIDFGVAKATAQKLTERTMFTEFGQVLGTMEYMSPEQSKFNQLDIDTRSDIYSLGVLLYELLAGSTPFEGKRLHEAAFDEMLRIIREEDPPKPSTRISSIDTLPSVAANRHTEPARLSKDVRGELDWIVMKALEKDRNRRYETASGFAADIERQLHNEPVEAGPPSTTYRFRKFARRNSVVLTTGLLLIGTLLLGTAISTWQLFRAMRAAQVADAARSAEAEQRTQAEQQRQQAEARAYASDMSLASQSASWGANLGSVQELLSHWRDSKPDRRGWEWYYLNGLCHRDLMTVHADNIGLSSVAWSPDGKRFASAGGDSTVKIWNALNGQRISQLVGHTAAVTCVVWSSDGKRLASASHDDTIKIWDVETEQEQRTLRGHLNEVLCVAWSPDDSTLASASADNTIRTWDAVTGAEILTLATPSDVSWINWDSKGTRLASTHPFDTTRIWDSKTGNPIRTLTHDSRKSGAWAVAWSPNDQWLATSSGRIWNADTGECVKTLRGGDFETSSVAWSPDGTRLAASCRGAGAVRIWDTESGNEIQFYRGHMGAARSVAWRPSGNQIASAGSDGTIKVWDAGSENPSLTIRRQPSQVNCVAWNSDGTRLATASSDATIYIWGTMHEAMPVVLRGHSDCVWQVAWNPAGTQLASCGIDGCIKVWNPMSAKELWSVHAYALQARSLAWSPNGKRLISIGEDSHPKLWDAATGEVIATIDDVEGGLAVAWSPDGLTLAFGSWDTVLVADAQTGQKLCSLGRHRDVIRSLAWSADSKRLASASYDTTIKIWDLNSRREIRTLFGHSAQVYSAAWNPDGTRLVTASWDGTVKIWNARSGEDVCTLLEPIRKSNGVSSAAWSPDGSRIASCDLEGLILIHDSRLGHTAEQIEQRKTAAQLPPTTQRKHLSDELMNVMNSTPAVPAFLATAANAQQATHE